MYAYKPEMAKHPSLHFTTKGLEKVINKKMGAKNRANINRLGIYALWLGKEACEFYKSYQDQRS